MSLIPSKQINGLNVVHAKGKILVSDGTKWSELAVGTNDYVLTADSAQTTGIKWAATSGGVGGSGTLNYLAKFTPDGNTLGNSLVFDNGTNVGVNTTSLSAMLHVKGSTSDSTAYALKVDNLAGSPLLYVQNNGNVGIGTTTPAAYLQIKSTGVDGTTNAFLVRNSFNTNILCVNDSAKVGINTINPLSELHISGELRVQSTGHSRFNLVGSYSNQIWFGNSTSTLNQYIIGNHGFNPEGLIFGVSTGGSTGNIALMLTQYRNVGIGFNGDYTDITARTHIKGSTNDSTAYALKVDNSLNSPLLYVKNNGVVSMPNLPTSSAGLSAGDLWNNSGVINIV